MKVAIHEFRARFSRYLAAARRGEEIEVTSHRKVVGRLVGVPDAGSSAVAKLLASGAATWAGGKPTGARIRLLGGKTVAELLLKDRG